MMASTHAFEGAGSISGVGAADATGDSMASLLANGNGQMKMAMAGGDLSALLVDLTGLQFGNALLSALGVPYTRKPINVYSDGIRNVAAAMSRHEVKRLVVVSSSATEPHHHADGGFLMNRVLQPLITATIGKTTYSDMRAMEELVRGSDLEWTIMRPSGLFDALGITRYELHQDQAPGIFTSRADLAASMLEQATQTWYVARRSRSRHPPQQRHRRRRLAGASASRCFTTISRAA